MIDDVKIPIKAGDKMAKINLDINGNMYEVNVAPDTPFLRTDTLRSSFLNPRWVRVYRRPPR